MQLKSLIRVIVGSEALLWAVVFATNYRTVSLDALPALLEVSVATWIMASCVALPLMLGVAVALVAVKQARKKPAASTADAQLSQARDYPHAPRVWPRPGEGKMCEWVYRER